MLEPIICFGSELFFSFCPCLYVNVFISLLYSFLSRYFILTPSDVEEWHQNPESFHHEQDAVLWSEKLGPCAEALYIILFENHSQVGLFDTYV